MPIAPPPPAIDCQAFAPEPPVAITVQALAPSEIARDATVVTPMEPSHVGRLFYRGYGVDIRSRDPRFAAIGVSQAGALVHPCGYQAWGPGGWNAFDVKPEGWTMRFERDRGERGAGVDAAALAGVIPKLPGAVAGPTWPVYTGGANIFLGVMTRPDTEGSVIVAFANRPGEAPAREIARLAFRATSLSIVPDLHGPTLFVNLTARMPDGALREVVLGLPDAVVAALAGEVKP